MTLIRTEIERECDKLGSLLRNRKWWRGIEVTIVRLSLITVEIWDKNTNKKEKGRHQVSYVDLSQEETTILV